MNWREEYRRDGHVLATYRIFDDGTVVAYGPERDGPGTWPHLWIASAWTAHPLDDPKAEHIGHLCLDAPRAELNRALAGWSVLADWRAGRREVI